MGLIHIFHPLIQRNNAVRQIALPGGGGDHQHIFTRIGFPVVDLRILIHGSLVSQSAEDRFCFFRNQQRVAVHGADKNSDFRHAIISLD